MSLCKICGSQMEEGSTFCSNCGAKQDTAPEFSYEQADGKAQTDTTTATSSFTAVPEKLKKKSAGKKAVIGIVAALLVLVAAGAIALASSSSIKNTFKLMTSSPDTYLKDTLSDSMKNSIDSYYNSLKETKNKNTTEYNGMDLSLKFEPGTFINTMLSSYADVKLDSIGANLSYAASKDNVSFDMSLLANDKSLASINSLINLASSPEILFRIPELTPSYIKVTLNDMLSSMGYLSLDELLESFASEIGYSYPSDFLSEATMDKCVDALLKIIGTEVTLDKNAELKAGSVTGTYNKFTTDITEEAFYDAICSILSILNEDKAFSEYYNLMSGEYGMTIDELILEIEDEKEYIDEDSKPLEYSVWIDNNGDIKAQEIKIDKNSSIGYYMPQDGSKHGILFKVKDDGSNVFLIEGEYTDKSGAKSGEIELTVNSYDYYTDSYSTSTTFLVEFSNVKCDSKNMSGTYTFTTNLLVGSSLVLTQSGTTDDQTLTAEIVVQGIPVGKFTLTSKLKKDASATKADTSAKVYSYSDYDDLYEYEDEIDMNAFLMDILNKLGLDLSVLGMLDSYFY